MALFEMFSWWYLAGWNTFLHKIRASLVSVIDFFSMSSLIRTLFKPYRQISADPAHPDSGLSLRFNMFIDRLISRLVGFCSRLILLLIGALIIILGGISSLLLLILWPFLPLLPLAGLILSLIGFTL